MGVATILEVGIGVVLRRWRTMLALAIIFVAPAALFTAAAGSRLSQVALDVFPAVDELFLETVPPLTQAEAERLVAALAVLLAAMLLAGILGSIGAVAFSAAVLGPRDACNVELIGALRMALRRIPSVVAFMLVTSALVVGLVLAALVGISILAAASPSASLAEGGPATFAALVIGVTLTIALAYLTMRWAAAYPVMAVEQAGWRTALARSWALSSDNVLRVAGVVILATLLTSIGAAVLGQLLSGPSVALLQEALGLDPLMAESLVMTVVTVVLAPIPPTFLAVLYADLRARRPSAGDPRGGIGRAEG